MSTRTICFQLVEISTMPPSLQTSSNPYMLEEWHPGLGIGAKMACGLDSALICVCSSLYSIVTAFPNLREKNEREAFAHVLVDYVRLLRLLA